MPTQICKLRTREVQAGVALFPYIRGRFLTSPNACAGFALRECVRLRLLCIRGRAAQHEPARNQQTKPKMHRGLRQGAAFLSYAFEECVAENAVRLPRFTLSRNALPLV